MATDAATAPRIAPGTCGTAMAAVEAHEGGPVLLDVHPDRNALMQAVARRFASSAAHAIGDHGRFAVALAGGSTPKAAYELLAGTAYAETIDWSRVEVFFGDERCVAPEDPASNYRMAREALLDHVALPPANVHRMHGEDDPAQAADSYERDLRRAFATLQGLPRREPGACFDLVLLGLGHDGHTASLFPGSKAVAERGRWVEAVYAERVSMWRITLTPVIINAAEEILFVVSGGSKSEALYAVIEEAASEDRLPARAIAPGRGRLRWMVDAEAAALLAGGRRQRAGEEQ